MMKPMTRVVSCPLMAVMILMAASTARCATKDLGDGFRDHGAATPVSTHRGLVATEDADGRNVVLLWLMDHRGGYAILMIDAETGKAEQIPMPVGIGGDSPFSSILATNNRFYTHYGSHFFEFDPAQRKFTFFHKTAPQMAMGMTEDDNGVIWSASYPQSGLVSYNPKTGEFKDYGHLYKQTWAQYPRYVAADDAGWIYFGIGSTASQIIAFHPATATTTPIVRDEERQHGSGQVTRDVNGKVYAHTGGAEGKWIELYKGVRTDLEEQPAIRAKSIITGSQGLFHRVFPDGKILKTLDPVEKVMVVEDPETKEEKRLTFDYTSDGAHVMGVNAAPNGTIAGGSAFPFRFFSYNPKTDQWQREPAFLQFNTVVTQGDKWYTGGYGHGFLLEWDPAQPWQDTKKGQAGNPLWLAEANPDINRPHDLLAHPDGKTLVLAGTPGYGLTGGGLMFWDRETKQAEVIKHTHILPDHSPMSLVALPEGKLLIGTTIAAGTGGQVKAKVAELAIMDMASKQIEWHEAVLPNVYSYHDMVMAQNGMVFGIADGKRLFAFDPETRQIVMEKDIGPEFGSTTGEQQARTFVVGPDGTIYVLLRKGFAVLDPETRELQLLVESPVPVTVGGDILDGRIYFVSGSHLCSWEVKK